MSTSTVTGLASGLDWSETVQLLMQIERQPVVTLEERREMYESQLTNWSSLESKLNALKTTSESIDEMDEFLVKTGTSNDDDVLTVSANSTAILGSHSVLVNQIATNHVHVHTDGWADLDTTAINDSGSDQSFSFSYGGEAFTITVPDGTTLQGVVNLINNDADNPGVTASVINDGGDDGTPYHLTLTGEDTGEDNSITIIDTQDNPTDLGDGSEFDEAGWDTTQAAQNAEIRVDGFPDPGWGWPNPWIESDSNEVEDIIPGVTLHLNDDSEGETINIEISLDSAAVTSKVNSLIDAYNSLVAEITDLTGYDTEEETAGPLNSDSLAKSIKRGLMNFIAYNIPGKDEDDQYNNLGSVGLTLSSGGLLTLDTDKFEDALEDDATSVGRLFGFDATASTSFISIEGHSYNTVGGTYDFTVSYDADGNLDSGGTNTINGENGVIQGDDFLEGAEDSDVEGLLLQLANPGDGPSSLSGSVTVYTGLAVLFANQIDDILDTTEGTLKITRDRINDTIDLIDDKIERWERRLEQVEENYTQRFLNMELAISTANTTSQYLDNAF